MTRPPARARAAAWGLLALLVGGFLALVQTGAQAATHAVTLTSNGPSPQTVTINRGDTVTFANADSVNHTITHNAGAWSYQATIRPGASSTTPAFRTAGQYGYSDQFFVLLVRQQVDGFVSVRAPAPSPTPSPTKSRTPSPTPSPTPTKSPTPQPTTPSPTPSASPSGIAIGPGIGGLPSLTPSGGPTPNVAPPETSSAAPGVVAYGPKSELAQSSAHRFGLPVLLALLGVVGALSLLVRLLLAEPADT